MFLFYVLAACNKMFKLNGIIFGNNMIMSSYSAHSLFQYLGFVFYAKHFLVSQYSESK